MHIVILGKDSAKKVEGVVKKHLDNLDISIFPTIGDFVHKSSLRAIKVDRFIFLQDTLKGEVDCDTKLGDFNNYICKHYPGSRFVSLCKDKDIMLKLANIFLSSFMVHIHVTTVKATTLIDMASEPIDVLRKKYGADVVITSGVNTIEEVISIDKEEELVEAHSLEYSEQPVIQPTKIKGKKAKKQKGGGLFSKFKKKSRIDLNQSNENNMPLEAIGQGAFIDNQDDCKKDECDNENNEKEDNVEDLGATNEDKLHIDGDLVINEVDEFENNGVNNAPNIDFDAFINSSESNSFNMDTDEDDEIVNSIEYTFLNESNEVVNSDNNTTGFDDNIGDFEPNISDDELNKSGDNYDTFYNDDNSLGIEEGCIENDSNLLNSEFNTFEGDDNTTDSEDNTFNFDINIVNNDSGIVDNDSNTDNSDSNINNNDNDIMDNDSNINNNDIEVPILVNGSNFKGELNINVADEEEEEHNFDDLSGIDLSTNTLDIVEDNIEDELKDLNELHKDIGNISVNVDVEEVIGVNKLEIPVKVKEVDNDDLDLFTDIDELESLYVDSQTKLVEKEVVVEKEVIVEKEVVVEKVVQKIVKVGGNLAYRDNIRCVIVTGDRRSGVTTTALNLASRYANTSKTLYVDFDIERKGSIALLGLDTIIDEPEHIQKGMAFIKDKKMLDHITYKYTAKNFDCLLSMYGVEVDTNQLSVVQSVLSVQRTYDTVIVDCPIKYLGLLTDLCINAEVVFCVEDNYSGVLNTIFALSEFDDSSVSPFISKGRYFSKNGDKVKIEHHMEYIDDIFSLGEGRYNWAKMPIYNSLKELSSKI